MDQTVPMQVFERGGERKAETEAFVHGQAAAVVDPSGRLATIYYGQTWEPEHLLRDLEKARKG